MGGDIIPALGDQMGGRTVRGRRLSRGPSGGQAWEGVPAGHFTTELLPPLVSSGFISHQVQHCTSYLLPGRRPSRRRSG